MTVLCVADDVMAAAWSVGLIALIFATGWAVYALACVLLDVASWLGRKP